MKKIILLFGLAVVFTSCATAQKTSMQYLEEGSVAYLAGNFKKAIPPYQKALDLEKQDRKLAKNFWYVLVDNLAIAYGVTGDIKRSMDVLDYGISKEPEYPMFYYNMACGYGEKDDEANAIKYLKLAFRYKDNMVEGEHFPDPETDSSFERLMQRKSFRSAVATMKGGE
jgi:tetratricopeptide (TPR) repeat protein